MQVENTICAATPSFSENEEIAAKELANKSHVIVKENLLRFNGIEISISTSDDRIIMNQAE